MEKISNSMVMRKQKQGSDEKNVTLALWCLNQLIVWEGRIRALKQGEHLNNNLESTFFVI